MQGAQLSRFVYRFVAAGCSLADLFLSHFVDESALEAHVDSAHNGTTWTCTVCSQSFANGDDLAVSVLSSLSRNRVFRTLVQCFARCCALCATHAAGARRRYLLTRRTAAQEHERTAHDSSKATFACPECPRVYESSVGLYYHRRSKHMVKERRVFQPLLGRGDWWLTYALSI